MHTPQISYMITAAGLLITAAVLAIRASGRSGQGMRMGFLGVGLFIIVALGITQIVGTYVH